MIREVKFESQDRRIKQILAALNANGRNSAYLLRKCKMGLRCRLCHCIEERLQKRC